MSFEIHECERCSARVRQQGDHLCPPCAKALGRNVSQPFWGNFRNHPDARLRIGEISRARDFVGVVDGILASGASSAAACR